jgi:predicted oxidoreductase
MKKNPIVGCMRWGVWGENFTTKQYETIIDQCLSIGLNIFDHADIYGHYTTEADFGQALKNNSSLRQQMKLITKCGINMLTTNRPEHSIKSYNTSAEHIKTSIENSLRNFHTDYIDTLLIHRPDLLLNPEEVAHTITELKTSGKLRSFGVSNFNTYQVASLSKYIKVEHHQVEISVTRLNSFDDGVLDQCQQLEIEAQSWSPLGNGLFSGDNVVGNAENKNKRILKIVHELADKYKTGVNEILLAFLYIHPAHIVPVIGTTKFERIESAKRAMEITLTREDFYKLLEASTGHEVA